MRNDTMSTEPEIDQPFRVFEVRYDDEESYHVAARFTNEALALGLRDRLATAHTDADGDACLLDSSWLVVAVAVNDVRPTVDLPPELFDNSRDYDDHHADVNTNELPLAAIEAVREGADAGLR